MLNSIPLLQEVSILFNLILLACIFILALALHGALKQFGHHERWQDKLKIIFHLFSKEPAHVFSQAAKRNERGTYTQPFVSYWQFHNISKKTLLHLIGLIILQLGVFGLLAYSAALAGHSSRASGNVSAPSNNFLQQLDQ